QWPAFATGWQLPSTIVEVGNAEPRVAETGSRGVEESGRLRLELIRQRELLGTGRGWIWQRERDGGRIAGGKGQGGNA
ncbi:hypothetical protein chiPu_0025306, partial [Chiloscyllium punctatum]|nr:hypothetical protein [Chiloscyllium punctatum]